MNNSAAVRVSNGFSDQVTVPYGSKSKIVRWFDEYFTERDRRALPWLATSILLVFLLAGPAFLLWLASLLPVDQLGNSGSSVLAHRIVQTIAAVLAASAGAFLLARLAKPSLINVSREGISADWLVFGIIPLKGPVLQWKNVKAVRLVKPHGVTDPRANVLHIAASKSSNDMKLLLGELDSDEQRKAICDALCANVSNIDAAAVEALTPRRSLSFTEVWLDALSAPPGRERLLPLNENTLLDTRYRIVRQLGAGGQGTVYLAEDTKEHGNVVLKETILPVYADIASRKKALEDFHKEAFALESVKHPNIVKFRGSFVADHRAYLVLDLVPGIPLSETVKRRGCIDHQRATKLAAAMCDILAALHNASPPLIHRDFTPDNLMLDENDRLVLIDFAVSVNTEKSSSDVAGKASYMAPEQFKGKPTSQSDIYSMGCTLYYALTGLHPEPLEECHPILIENSVPKALNDFVARCTRLDVAARFQTAEHAKAAIPDLKS